jgi:hypothetical protein
MRLFADFRQIHVCAPDRKGDLAEAWTAKATDDRIAAAGDIVGIGTERMDDVNVTFEIVDREPVLQKADHVTEASIKLPGVVAVLGCTDYLPDAKRFKLAPGTWRLRATHTNLAKRERIHIQLWPGKATRPRVRTRWQPAKPVDKPIKGKPKTRKQAVEAALRGDIDVALDVLLALHAAGDAAASASAAEILAFQGRWDEMVPCAKALLANPRAVYAGNVIDDMKALVNRRTAIAKPPAPEPADRKSFDEAVQMAADGKRYKGKPEQLSQHCFALAVVFHVDDEIIARWDPDHPYLHFDQAAEVARALMRRDQAKRAWEILESRLGRWYPVDAAQVLPVELITDPLLAPLLTRERADLVLRTPRARQ